MADYILKDGGRILTVANKKGTEETYDAEDGHSLEIPMVVLVNGNSASASEVFTGAMKDYGVATIVGTKTFGKGIVQTLMPLSDGSAIKLTTDHYYTPMEMISMEKASSRISRWSWMKRRRRKS